MNNPRSWMRQVLMLMAMVPAPVMAEEAKSKTQTLKAESFRVELKLDGVFEAENAQGLSVKTQRWHKHVKTLEVKEALSEGSIVKAGSPLVHFDTAEIDLAIRDAELALAAAANELARQREVFAHAQKAVEITRSNAERTHRRAENALKRFLEIDRPLETRKAEFSLKYAQQRLAYAQEELKQLQKMYKEDDLTEETEEIILQRQKNAVESSAFNVEQAQISKQAVLDEVLPNRQEDFEAALHAARVELQRVQGQIPLDIERSRQALTKAEVAHADAAHALEEFQMDRAALTVTAPVAGVVRYGRAEQGAWVEVDNVRRAMRPGGKIVPHAEFITVVADGPLRLRAVVPEAQSRWVKPGLAGRVSPKMLVDHRLPSEVIQIEPVRRPDGAIDVLLGVDVPENLSLRPGMHAQISFHPYEREKALVVPIAAVRWHAGHEPYVILHIEDRTQRKPVTLGPRDGDRIEILKGLSEGDVVELNPSED